VLRLKTRIKQLFRIDSRVPNSILTIDRGLVVDNWLRITSRVTPRACGAVLKANAYGLGLREVAPVLWRAGCRHFFVSTFVEGVQLRSVVPESANIYALHGCNRDAAAAFAAARITPVLNTTAEILEWIDVARGESQPAIAVQVDTGMARLGISFEEFEQFAVNANLIAFSSPLILSHLVAAEEEDAVQNAQQLRRFQEIRRLLPAGSYSLANSAAIELGPDFLFDITRVGAALFGAHFPSGATEETQLVIRLQARVLQLRELGAEEGVGYNHSWRSPRNGFRVATLAVGYAGGIPRSLANTGCLSINGWATPVVGKVSMDCVTVDVNLLPSDLLREQMLVNVIDSIDTMRNIARDAGTIPAELLLRICQGQHERQYTDLVAEATMLGRPCPELNVGSD
jgi:alanine racemase